MQKKDTIKNGYFIAFGDLYLKSSGVKNLLINRLIGAIKNALKTNKIDFRVMVFHDHLFIITTPCPKTDAVISNIFGIGWYARCFYLRALKFPSVINFIKDNYHYWIPQGKSFAIIAKRDKQIIKEPSREISVKVGAVVERVVNLSNPDKTIHIEAKKEGWFVYLTKNPGLGGFPEGSQGRAIALLSGGIDSPVASYLIMKKGVTNIWLHFHSYPLSSDTSMEKVKKLAQQFTCWQKEIKLCLVPFSDIQSIIKLNTDAKLRVLLYRRYMIRLACLLAQEERASALISGESLGQVSSQTLGNLALTNNIANIPILRPLIAMDKGEIISLAKKINSYKTSILPQEDCCTFYVPKHQTANGKIGQLQAAEKLIDKKIDLKKIAKQKEIIIYR